MAAVKHQEADRFVAAPPRGVFVFLVFGSDAGLISERVQKLVAGAVDDPKDPFQLVRLDTERLAADPALLVDEVQTLPLFGGRRAILIEATGKNIAPAVEPILDLGPADCAVIIEAAGLKRDAPLRKMIERARGGAAIECFPDEARDVARLIDDEARAAGVEVEAPARDALVHLLGADRLTTRSELAKLMLYAHGTGRVTLEDVEAVVTDASASVHDAAVDGAYLGDFAAIDATLARAFAEGGDPGVLLGAALRHGISLHRARIDADSNRSPSDAAEAAARSGLYFKRKPAFERQLRGWSAAKLARALAALDEAVAKCRREPRLARVIAARALWTVASAAAGRQG